MFKIHVKSCTSGGHHAADGAPQDLGRRSKVEGSLTRIGVPQADTENSAGSLLPLDVWSDSLKSKCNSHRKCNQVACVSSWSWHTSACFGTTIQRCWCLQRERKRLAYRQSGLELEESGVVRKKCANSQDLKGVTICRNHDYLRFPGFASQLSPLLTVQQFLCKDGSQALESHRAPSGRWSMVIPLIGWKLEDMGVPRYH